MGADTFFQTAQKDVIKFQPLGAMQSDECDAWLALVRVSITDQRRGVEEVSEGFAGFDALGNGANQFLKILNARNIFGRIAIAQHRHVACFVQKKAQEFGRLFRGVRVLEVGDKLLESAQWRDGATARTGGKNLANGIPEGEFTGTRGLAQNINGGFANSARRNVQNAPQRY